MTPSACHFRRFFYTRTMKNHAFIVLFLLLAALLISCSDTAGEATTETGGGSTSGTATPPTSPPADGARDRGKMDYGPPPKADGWREPVNVQVQHILISFTGARGEPRLRRRIHRSKKEARELAQELVRRLRDGENMLPLVKEYTQDSAPGIYSMSTLRERPGGSMPRSGMVKGFGDVSYRLAVGEVAMTEYDPVTSPFGYHVIKRLK